MDNNRRNLLIIGGIVAAIIIALVLVLVASGDDDEDTASTTIAASTTVAETTVPETTAPATTTPETTAPATTPPTTEPPATTTPPTTPPTTEPPATTVPEPDGTIPDGVAGAQLVPNPGTEDITDGDVFAYWYRNPESGNYIALYTGEGVAGGEGQGLCPGNSIFTDNFEFISNAPTEEDACEGFPTDVGAVQVCTSGVWIYETMIPGDTEGILFGSLEWNTDGGIAGLSSQVESQADLPEFESGLTTYAIGAMMTVDGATEITCDEALT